MNMVNQSLMNSQYQIKGLINSGTFGQVFEAIDVLTNERVALKKEINHKIKHSTFTNESQILQMLQGIEGIPKLYWHGRLGMSNVIVTQILEKDLSSYLRVFKKFSLRTVLILGMQILTILEQMHQRHIVHRDIKPENVLYGQNKRFYLCDFGISKQFVKHGKVIPRKINKNFVGTNKYAPIVSHEGCEQYPKDDIESLMYVLIYLLRGSLPWEGLSDHKSTGVCKNGISLINLCLFAPKQFQTIFEHLRKLSHSDYPNYSLIYDLFQQIGFENKISLMDSFFEWDKKCIDVKRSSLQTPTLDIYYDIGRQSQVFTPNQIHRMSERWADDDEVNYISFDEDEDTIDIKYKKLKHQETRNKFTEFLI